MNPTLKIENLGQIKEATLELGDLTVLVGPQATGKSIALQTLKLAIDAGQVQDEMGRYGLDWRGRLPEFLDAYFGEGMRGIWKKFWRGSAACDSICSAELENWNLTFLPAPCCIRG